MGLLLAFVAGIGATFLFGDGSSNPWLPLWAEAYLDVARAMKTLWYHQTLVQQLESWAGMPLSMFSAASTASTASAALPTIIIGGLAKVGWPLLVNSFQVWPGLKHSFLANHPLQQSMFQFGWADQQNKLRTPNALRLQPLHFYDDDRLVRTKFW